MNAPLPPCHFPDCDTAVRRFREAGDLTLDLFHRDGRIDDRWLGLHLREFALLWRLARHPGECLTGLQLMAEAWRVAGDAESASIATQVELARAKLALAGCAQLIGTDADGRYFLDVPPATGLSRI